MGHLQLAILNASPRLNEDFQKSLDLFYSRIPLVVQSGRGLIQDSNVDLLIQRAMDFPGTKYVAIIAMGTLFPDQSRIVQLIEQAIEEVKKPFLVMGQLIDKKSSYCGIHEQLFIVDVEMYKNLGQPPFGLADSDIRELHNYFAGPSFHDDYTPHWVKPAPGSSQRTTQTAGWNFVHRSLSADLSVANLPSYLRDEKIYSYPEDQPEVLNKNLDLLYQMADLPNESQRRVLGFLFNKRFGFEPVTYGNCRINLSHRKSSVYLFNTEYLIPDLDWVETHRQPLDHYLGPCSGFLEAAALFAHGSHSQTKITYFDYNPKTIHYKKRMLEEFDGRFKSLKPLFKKFLKQDPDQPFVIGDFYDRIEKILMVFKCEENFTTTWQKVRALPKEFVQVNLFSQSQLLFSRIQREERTLLSISDIFTGTNELTYGWSTIEKTYKDFIRECHKYPQLVISGNDTRNRSFVAQASSLGTIQL